MSVLGMPRFHDSSQDAISPVRPWAVPVAAGRNPGLAVH
jgi:hypothetical protein